MAGRHRAPYDPEAKRLEREFMKQRREAMKRERAARGPEPANWWTVKFSIFALVFSAAFGVFVWFTDPQRMWLVGLQALIYLAGLVREIHAHLRYRAANSPEKTPH
ncbi:hypothetical protein ACFYOC_22765 [Nocardiopsis alba]|uniref:hypothetical protein n=1 Tax=Nocardiopsis alba TaxID=53437 RepID=UPI0036BA2AC8